MVSNSSIKNINRAYFIRPIFIIGLLVFTTSISFSQDIKKFYSSTIQENGTLYFIEPEYEYKNGKESTDFTFDLTHLSSEDSVVINFTFRSKNLFEFETLTFDNELEKITSPAEIIFIEARKKIWYHRYTSKFLLSDIEKVFVLENKATVSIAAKKSVQTVNIKKSKWVKKTEILSKILTVINANK